MGKKKKEISLKYILLFLLKVSLKEKIIIIIITTFFTTTEVVGYDWCTIKIMLIIVQIK